MGAKIGFQQKISPFRLAKQYLKYLEGWEGLRCYKRIEAISFHETTLLCRLSFFN